ncbi:hypothetical protein FGO68_gene9311 [Halteria grandinella]|uniref:Glucosylceramidase n=1 Tax=Halteria grandinella TaxID=5974 RepID=A0A8J8NSU0_HALGN|nr:hypothetical protein FGO68_gene9311 [Halteria grandinella]
MHNLLLPLLILGHVFYPAYSTIQVLLTTGDKQHLLSPQPNLIWSTGQSGNIIIDTTKTYQTMEGVGASFTDSAAYLMNKKLSSAHRTALLNELFGKEGANLNMIRIPLSSSDMATADFTSDDMPQGKSDPLLEKFKLNKHHTDSIPILQEIKNIQPELSIMGTPWSAPGWMKSGNRGWWFRKGIIAGTLNEIWVEVYAEYLTKIIEAFASYGLVLDTMTLQNEPAFTPWDYAGMNLTAEQEANLAISVGKALQDRSLDTKILVHDHNWDIAYRATRVLENATAAQFIHGIAFHCYGGDVSAQSTVKAAYPDKEIYFTECSGTLSSGNFLSNLMWNVNNLVIGNIRNWGKTVMLWSLALDKKGNPNVGGCKNCRGVVTISNGKFTKNEEYYVLAHVSRVAQKGSYRVESTERYQTVRSVAFINPDNSSSLILCNDAQNAVHISIQDDNMVFTYTMPSNSVASFSWTQDSLFLENKRLIY